MSIDGSLSLSVVVPTRNRCERLAVLLRSVSCCTVPAGVSVELIVVDNGSTDRTRHTVEEVAPQVKMPLRYFYEARPGVSRARNTGARQGRGAVIAFVDDDCEVAVDWLTGLHVTFQEFPQLSGLFGRVLPADDLPVDATTLSVKPSLEAKDYRFPCSPFVGHGNNMAFRREAFLAAGGFDVAYGPGAPLWGAEELDLGYRLLRNGAWLRYEPRVVIEHMPRATVGELLAAHQRNAIGLGACLTKYSLRGDRFAVKTAWWWWWGTWESYWRAVREHADIVRRVKGLYLRWFPWGTLLRVGYEIRAMVRPATEGGR